MSSQPPPPSSVAVLMTCHNRRELTLRCLRSLAAQRTDADVAVYLVDDGSSDGTASAVHFEFPKVRVLAGTGQLYWSGGMRVAQEAAVLADPDFLLWLNDDVEMEAEALATLLATHHTTSTRGNPDSVVVGAMKDPRTGETTYSGVVRRDRIRRMQFSIVEPACEPVPSETMHGNLVLVPRSVYTCLGPFDAVFTHSMSDYDYGLRAQSNGFEVWVAPGRLGTCTFNSTNPPGLDSSVPLRDRVRHLVSPRGLPPREWLHFTRRHGGVFWTALFVTPYLRFIGRAATSLGPLDRRSRSIR